MSLPSAAPVTTLTLILTSPNVSCVSLNMSRMPDGRYRATVMRGREWLKGFGATPEAALEDIRKDMQ